jgi:hypothetical protein
VRVVRDSSSSPGLALTVITAGVLSPVAPGRSAAPCTGACRPRRSPRTSTGPAGTWRGLSFGSWPPVRPRGGSLQTLVGALHDQLPLELIDGGEVVEHEPPRRGGGVDVLLEDLQVDAARLEIVGQASICRSERIARDHRRTGRLAASADAYFPAEVTLRSANEVASAVVAILVALPRLRPPGAVLPLSPRPGAASPYPAIRRRWRPRCPG